MISSAECLPQAAEYARLAREAEGRQMRSALYGMSRIWETMAKFATQLEALALMALLDCGPSGPDDTFTCCR
jgi:hypothetical protein